MSLSPRRLRKFLAAMSYFAPRQPHCLYRLRAPANNSACSFYRFIVLNSKRDLNRIFQSLVWASAR